MFSFLLHVYLKKTKVFLILKVFAFPVYSGTTTVLRSEKSQTIKMIKQLLSFDPAKNISLFYSAELELINGFLVISYGWLKLHSNQYFKLGWIYLERC